MNKERLFFIRESFGLSQKRIALFLNTSNSNYSKWETGETLIPLKYVIKLSNKFHYSLDYVLNLSNNNNKKIKYTYICNNITIGKNIKEIRKKNNLTQKEFAKSINTTQSVISNYENGHTLIETSFLLDICLKYNISADYLINHEIWEVYHND